MTTSSPARTPSTPAPTACTTPAPSDPSSAPFGPSSRRQIPPVAPVQGRGAQLHRDLARAGRIVGQFALGEAGRVAGPFQEHCAHAVPSLAFLYDPRRPAPSQEIPMAYELPALPYDFGALAPHIDEQTMQHPSRQAPSGLHRQGQRGARRHRVREQVRRGGHPEPLGAARRQAGPPCATTAAAMPTTRCSGRS